MLHGLDARTLIYDVAFILYKWMAAHRQKARGIMRDARTYRADIYQHYMRSRTIPIKRGGIVEHYEKMVAFLS